MKKRMKSTRPVLKLRVREEMKAIRRLP